MGKITSFHAQLPVRIAFGDGVVGELPDALGARAALVDPVLTQGCPPARPRIPASTR